MLHISLLRVYHIAVALDVDQHGEGNPVNDLIAFEDDLGLVVGPSRCGKLAYLGGSVVVVGRPKGRGFSGYEVLLCVAVGVLWIHLLGLYASGRTHVGSLPDSLDFLQQYPIRSLDLGVLLLLQHVLLLLVQPEFVVIVVLSEYAPLKDLFIDLLDPPVF